ncbi:MAG TPA: Dabb family protein [Terrimesophilobacter sp.]|nr:Dabb family protein [Terrimesophilobacter sp.]
MIVHNIAFKLAETDSRVRAEQTAEFARRIRDLEGKVPGLQSISVGTDFGRIADHYDLVLVSHHDSYEDLEAYQAHPLHVEVIEYGKTIVSARACVDYEVG